MTAWRPALRGLRSEVRLRVAASRLEPNVTWIMGSPRSGTTWLANLLSSLTDAALVDEPLIGAHLSVHLGAVTSLPSPEDPQLYDASRGRDDYVFSDHSGGGVATPAPSAAPSAVRRFHRFETSRDHQGAERIAGGPRPPRHAPALAAAVPRARRPRRGRLAARWCDRRLDHAHARCRARHLGREEFIERRAHDWVRTVPRGARCLRGARSRPSASGSPTKTSGPVRRRRWRACSGGWARDDALPRVAEAVSLLSFERLPADKTGSGQFTRAAQPGLWREHFSPAEVEQLEAIMQPMLGELGYS